MSLILSVDTETTGVSESDVPIEIGAALYTDDLQLVEMHSDLEEPKKEVSPGARSLHGISDKMLAGRTFNRERFLELANQADWIMAHRALFDMRMLMNRFGRIPELRPQKWLCSYRLIDWDAILPHNRYKSVVYLAADKGLLNYFPHRAGTDALMLGLVALPHLDEMIEKASCSWIRIRAANVPFQDKGLVKNMGYRWNGSDKVWWTIIPNTSEILEEHKEKLRSRVYRGNLFMDDIEIKEYKRWYNVPEE